MKSAGVPFARVTRDGRKQGEDRVALEEPLEIRLAGDPFGVTMRTPGHDEELVLGLLFAEGVIASTRDVGAVVRCSRPGDPGEGNVIDVRAAPGTTFVGRTESSRRVTTATSACGVCGRQTIDDLLARCARVARGEPFSPEVVRGLTAALGQQQPGFAETGGLHAAGAADASGGFAVVREDVGRHNAVDKVVGRLLLDDALPARASALVVSSRVGFEIVQKAVVAGFPLVVGVSAPTSLAIATAERAGVTLVAFSRPDGFNVYTHPEGAGVRTE